MLRRVATIVFMLAAVVTIVHFALNVAHQKAEVKRLSSELESCTDRNTILIEQFARLAADGHFTPGEVLPHLTATQAKVLSQKVVEAVRLQLPIGVGDHYSPSGWMGDGELGERHLSIRGIPETHEGQSFVATKITYSPGHLEWAGIYWLHPDKNWGDLPGRTLQGAHVLTFLARGEEGGEVVEFKSGGVKNEERKHGDSYDKSIGRVVLNRHWTRYEIDLSKENLSMVIGAFAWIATADDNAGDVVTYVGDIEIY